MTTFQQILLPGMVKVTHYQNETRQIRQIYSSQHPFARHSLQGIPRDTKATGVTYSIGCVFVSDHIKCLGFFLQNTWVLDGIQFVGRTNERNIPLAHSLGIDLGEYTFLLQGCIEVFTNCTMSAVSSDENITAGSGVVVKSDGNSILILVKSNDLL